MCDKNRLDCAWDYISKVEPTTPFEKAVKEAMLEFLTHVNGLDAQVDLYSDYHCEDYRKLKDRIEALEKRIKTLEAKAPNPSKCARCQRSIGLCDC